MRTRAGVQARLLRKVPSTAHTGCSGEKVKRRRLKAGRGPGPPDLCPGLLPAWAQKGTVPSLCTRCGPLKLYLYSKRRCGCAPGVPVAPAAAGWPPTPSPPTKRQSDSSKAQNSGRAPAREPLCLDPAILDSGKLEAGGRRRERALPPANRALHDWRSPGDPEGKGELRPQAPLSRRLLDPEHLWAGPGAAGSARSSYPLPGRERDCNIPFPPDVECWRSRPQGQELPPAS